MHPRTLLLACLSLGTAVGHGYVTRGQITANPAPQHSAVHQPDWSTNPVSEDAGEALNIPTNIKTARDQRFANPMTPHIDYSENAHIGGRVYSMPRPVSLYPTTQSDLVIIGVPTNSASFMAANRSAVYTSIQVRVNKTLKPTNGNDINDFTILYPGGSIKTKQGTILRHEIGSGTTPLDLSREYLLFLTFDAVTDSYHILRAWDVSAPNPVALDQGGSPSRAPGMKEIKTLRDLEGRASLLPSGMNIEGSVR